MTVAEHHAPIEAQIPRLACRNQREFRRNKIFFVDVVFVFDQLQNVLFDGLFVFFFERIIADENIKVLALDDFIRLLLQLILRKMNEQIGHAKHRIIFVFTDHDIFDRAVFFDDNAMHCERQRHPLIFLDAAVIMCVEISEPAVFVERILLDVEAASVVVRAENFQPALERFRADVEKRDRLFHANGVNFIARAEFHARLELFVAGRLGKSNCLGNALALGLATADEVDVTRAKLVELLLLRIRVLAPNRKLLLF